MIALEYQLVQKSMNVGKRLELGNIRVVSAYADYFATIECEVVRCHV